MIIDTFLFDLIFSFSGRYFWFDFIAFSLSYILPPFLILTLIILFILNREKWSDVIRRALLAAIFTRIFLVEGIRYFFPRKRPFDIIDIDPLLPLKESGSLPSGHTAFFFAVSTVIFFQNKKLGVFFFISSFLIGFFRVSAGIHWPLDIVLGALLGLITGLLFEIIKEKKNRA